MDSVIGLLIILLLIVPLWRWVLWRQRFSALTQSISELSKGAIEVLKRLEVVEKRIDLIVPSQPSRQIELAPELEVAAPTATMPKATPFEAPVEAHVSPHVEEAEKQPLEAPRMWDYLAATRIAPPQPEQEEKLEKREQEVDEKGSSPSDIGRRQWGRVVNWNLPKFASTGDGNAVDWETLIGGSWLNVIGIFVFVVGMALFAQHSLTQLGPEGKIATGVITSVLLLVCGIMLEKFERYRLLAWTLVGGGWALLYFTAYAAHSIDASKVIADPAMGLLLMAGVAAGIIAHSLRYRSQLLTGLAYGVGFFAIAITPLSAYTLIATAVLALSQIGILRFLPWHYLVLVAIAGTYLNHARWLGQTIELQDDFWLSQLILCFYWVLFFAMALLKRPANRREPAIYLSVSVANTIGMLSLSAWQIWVVHGESLYYLTWPATVAYIATAAVCRFSDRADLFRFNSTVSVVLFAISLPLALNSLNISRDWLALYWVVGGIAVIASGYTLREIFLRLEGYALCGAAFVAVFVFNLQSSLPLADWRTAVWWVIPSVIAAFLGLSEWLQRVAGREGIQQSAREFGEVHGYAATGLLAAFFWKISDPYLLGLCWFATGLLFFESGKWRARLNLRNQGYLLFVGAFAALLMIDLFEIYPYFHQPLSGISPVARWLIVGTASAGYYYLFWGLRCEKPRFARTRPEAAFADLPSIAASALVTVLLWKQLDSTFIAIGWIVFGIILFEVGAWRSWSQLRCQGYVLFVLAFAALLSINLYELYPLAADSRDATLVPRWAIVGTSAAAYSYLFWQLRHEEPRFARTLPERMYADLASIAATTLVTILIWKELDSVTVAVGWAALALILFEIGSALSLSSISQQGHVLAILTFGRLFMANFIALGETMGISHRVLTVVPICTLFYYLYAQTRDRPIYSPIGRVQMSRLYSWGGAITLLALSRFELGRAYAAVGMAPLFVTFLILGRYSRDADFRFQSYILAALTFARCWATNAYLIGSLYGLPERVVTMLPAILAFAFATAFCMRRIQVEQITSSNALFGALQTIEASPQRYFALFGAATLAILLYYELPAGWVTTAIAIEGLILILTGITTQERSFRIYGLALLLVSLLKLVTIDVSSVEAIYRILSYIAVGLMLLAASLIYTRYRSVVQRYI
jgi:uncharacterized membrane protein